MAIGVARRMTKAAGRLAPLRRPRNQPSMKSAMRGLLAAILLSATACAAAELKAALPGRTRNLTLLATHTLETPPLPAHAARKPLALLLAGDGCARPPLSAIRQNGLPIPAFALMVRRGNCSFDDKMRFAVAAGATALIVADTMATQYEPVNESSGWTAMNMALRDPCAVSCDIGRGVVDTAELDVAEVLGGLAGQCPTASRSDQLGCQTGLCAFAQLAPPANGSSERQVCCALQTPTLQMAFPDALNSSSAGILPAVYLALAHGARLEAACAIDGQVRSVRGGGGGGGGWQHLGISACEIWLSEDPAGTHARAHGPYWDGSALIVWLFATGTAALAAHLAARAHDLEDREIAASGMGAPAEVEDATLDTSTALGFLLLASTFLVTLYLLLRAGFNVRTVPTTPRTSSHLPPPTWGTSFLRPPRASDLGACPRSTLPARCTPCPAFLIHALFADRIPPPILRSSSCSSTACSSLQPPPPPPMCCSRPRLSRRSPASPPAASPSNTSPRSTTPPSR